MSEILTLEIGQAGLQLSNAIWELFTMEHGVLSDGQKIASDELDRDQSLTSFFKDLFNNRFVPRSIKIDLEPTVIDEIKTGSYRHLFNPNSFVSANEDAGSNYARGHYTQGSIHIKRVMKTIRHFTEQCDSLSGFTILNSYDGGTGSGLTTRISENLRDDFSKTIQFQIGIFPSEKMSCSTVYAYNSLLHASNTMNSMQICTIVENLSLYDICGSHLELNKPTFCHVNRLISQIFSSFTVSTRFHTSINTNLDQVMTNLIPYPRIHYLISSFAPISINTVNDGSDDIVKTTTLDAFSLDNQFSTSNSAVDQYMSCLVQFRGDMMPSQINRALYLVNCQSDIEFVDWCPTGFKVGVCSRPPLSPPGSLLPQTRHSVTLFKNNGMITGSWARLLLKYDHLFSRRAFVQWFLGEGMEESEFTIAREDIFNLIEDYLGICDKIKLSGFDRESFEKQAEEHEYIAEHDQDIEAKIEDMF